MLSMMWEFNIWSTLSLVTVKASGCVILNITRNEVRKKLINYLVQKDRMSKNASQFDSQVDEIRIFV